MPIIFSPGEAETRPLDPEAIIYTSAQKVAELLGIGPSEAVATSADADGGAGTSAVYVTGADFRDHGFSVGDTVLIYSDAHPLGVTTVISTGGITNGGASGVKLAVDENLTAADFQTADNTFVQNQAAFTNGKTRGVTKDIVETHIKRIQDRIDNVTHNAWRPSIVIAEYLNFDTYKPYRRRYYTDYVGTVPLLFRNIQQIVRIELWQGDDYRELAGAEARLQISDYSLLSGDKVFLCPGGGGFAKLEVGTGTQQWNADFDNVTTAQALSDLINKENRVNRGTVAFASDANPSGTTFTLPDGASSTGVTSVYLHNEFLSTANSDYGNGKMKITSLKQTKGGDNATIAVTDNTNLPLTQTTTNTGTGTYNVGPATITFADASSFSDFGLVMAGDVVVGYTGKTSTDLTGVTVLDGALVDATSYSFIQHQFKSDIGAFSDAGGDQGRLKDWWLDHEVGIVYFNNSYPFFEWNAIKASYIYGERYLEQAIEEATTKLVASELLMSDDRSVLIPEGTQNVDLGSKIQLWRKEAESILNRYKEMVVFA